MQRLNIMSTSMKFPDNLQGQLTQEESKMSMQMLFETAILIAHARLKARDCFAVQGLLLLRCAALLAGTIGDRIARDVSTAMHQTSETAWSCCCMRVGCGVIS